MVDFKTFIIKLKEMISSMADVRRLTVMALADAFLGKTTSAEKIQKAQRDFGKNVDMIIKDLSRIEEYISKNAKEYVTDAEIQHAKKLIEEELTLFTDLRNEFFHITKSLPTGFIDMNVVKKRLQVDKIRGDIVRLNVLVGNIKHQWESEEYLLKYLVEKIGKVA